MYLSIYLSLHFLGGGSVYLFYWLSASDFLVHFVFVFIYLFHFFVLVMRTCVWCPYQQIMPCSQLLYTVYLQELWKPTDLWLPRIIMPQCFHCSLQYLHSIEILYNSVIPLQKTQDRKKGFILLILLLIKNNKTVCIFHSPVLMQASFCIDTILRRCININTLGMNLGSSMCGGYVRVRAKERYRWAG